MYAGEHSAMRLLAMMTVFVAGAVIFLFGFFPTSMARVNDEELSVLPNLTELTRPNRLTSLVYNQTILMLVDALRYDFPTPQTMPFTYQTACGQLQMRVNLPTVTMPRLKSLTTGTVSNFIDIVFNLGHEEKVENSILHGMRSRNYNMVFAGDRTWVELFPNIFQRKTPNIDSFFVNDFYEGDANVTRVLNAEVKLDDWHLFIVHYLGLDHIGHVEGSASAKILPKLMEMDDSIRQIYNAKHYHGQLVLLTGDHGMRNGGGHGGATWEEMHVPLLYFKEKCSRKSTKNAVYNQIDVAPTLAILMGINIPKNSIGCLVSELLDDLPADDQLQAYALNAHHLLNRIANKYSVEYARNSYFFTWVVNAQRLHSEYMQRKLEANFNGVVLFEEIRMEYMRASNEMSSQLSASLVNFDYDYISMGITIVTLLTLTMLKDVLSTSYKPHNFSTSQIFYTCGAAVVAYIILRFFDYIQAGSLTKCFICISSLCAIAYLVMESMQLYNTIKLRSISNYFKRMSISHIFLCTCYLFCIFSLGSSSFIEYEERSWYYLACSIFIQFVATVLCKTARTNCHRVNSIFNYLVMNFKSMAVYCGAILIVAIAPRYSEFTFTEVQISIVFCLGLILLAFKLEQLTTRSQSVLGVIALLCVCAIHNAEHGQYVNLLLTVFWLCTGGIAVLAHLDLSKKKPRITLLNAAVVCFIVITALLRKPQNVVLIPAMLYALEASYKLCDNLKTNENSFNVLPKVLLTIFVGKVFYFCQGNTNSLATIDLNPGYIGQSSYNPFIVFIFVTINTYSAPWSAFLYLVLHVSRNEYSSKRRQQHSYVKSELHLHLYLYIISILLPATVYMWLLIAMRFHLFIYSVFAPKIFYEIFNVFVHYIALAIAYFCL